jgi:hypothetical protein
LIELILAIKERVSAHHLEKYASITPNIHFLIVVAISEKAFRCSIPSSRDIFSVGMRRIDPFARAKVSKLDVISINENIFRFDVSVEYLFSVGVNNGF